MSRPLELPDVVLDELVRIVIREAPEQRVPFLASLGARLHASATRAIFNDIIVPDDTSLFLPTKKSRHSLHALLANPGRYGPSVRCLTVSALSPGQDTGAPLLYDIFTDSLPGDVSPMDTSSLIVILSACPSLEELVWESRFAPPDGLAEILAGNVKFAKLTLRAISHSQARLGATTKWDALSLPLLSSLPITSLSLARLSQAGVRALSELFVVMGDESLLEDVSLDLVWLDDTLCASLVKASRLRKIQLTTSGTKLTDKGIVAICERCDLLEELALIDVQGRLSSSLWTKPEHFPSVLSRFTITFSEAGPHHSWTMDHLQSLYALPKHTLRHISIERQVSPPRFINGSATYDGVADELPPPSQLPTEFLESLKDARLLRSLKCDWWSWQPSDIKVLSESCCHLESIILCLNAPFVKLLALSFPVSSLSHLRTLDISVPDEHAPGKAPILVPPHQDPAKVPPTPQDSPVSRAKTALPQLLDIDQMVNQTCVGVVIDHDPSMPLLRDVKRFARKYPRLLALVWRGRNGRGSWTVKRATSSKLGTNVAVDYHRPSISADTWDDMVREGARSELRTSANPDHGVLERAGQVWTGEVADRFAVQRAKELEKTARNREGSSRKLGANKQPSSPPALKLGSPRAETTVDMYLPISPPPSASSVSSLDWYSPPNSTRSPSLSMNGEASKSSTPTPTARRARAPSVPASKSTSQESATLNNAAKVTGKAATSAQRPSGTTATTSRGSIDDLKGRKRGSKVSSQSAAPVSGLAQQSRDRTGGSSRSTTGRSSRPEARLVKGKGDTSTLDKPTRQDAVHRSAGSARKTQIPP